MERVAKEAEEERPFADHTYSLISTTQHSAAPKTNTHTKGALTQRIALQRPMQRVRSTTLLTHSKREASSISRRLADEAREPPPRLTAKSHRYWLYDQLRTTTRKSVQPPAPLNELFERVTKRLMKRWADSTWSHRASVWSQYEEYLSHWGEEESAETAMCFVESKLQRNELTPSSAVTYVGVLLGALKRLLSNPDVEMMRDYAATLRKQAEAPNQAKPMTMDVVYQFIDAFLNEGNEDAALMLYTMWKTTSRFDDVRNLRRCDLTLVDDPGELVIHFRKTKNTESNPFRADAYVKMKEVRRPELMGRLHDFILRQPEEGPMVFHTTYNWLLRKFQAHGYMLHSCKRGSVEHTAMMVTKGLLETYHLSQAARHRVAWMQIADCTVRYLSANPELIANANGSARDTALK